MTSDAPLTGLPVLDIGEGLPAPFCAKLLADMGADVCKVERPPLGDPARALGPFPTAAVDREASGAFIFVNTSKRGITLDLLAEGGREILRDLLQHYDVVVAGETEGALAARGIGYEQLQEWNPAVILTTVSGFGSWGPHAGYDWSHLIACATGGWANNCGLPDREPLQAGGSLAEMFAGAYAATATMLAVMGRLAHGRGDHVDLSAQEAALTGALIPTLAHEYWGIARERQSDRHTGPSYVLPAARGHIGVNVLTQAQWELLCRFLGRPDMAEDPRFGPTERLAHAAEIAEEFAPIVAQRDPEELFHEAQAWRVPLGLVPTLEEIPRMPPHRDRGFFTSIELASGRSVEIPGAPWSSSGTAAQIGRPPRLGEHNAEIYGDLLGLSEERRAGLAAAGTI